MSTAGACSDGIVDIRDDLYAVQMLLIAGADSVDAQVARNDPREPLGEVSVPGATVRLIHQTDTLFLEPAGATRYASAFPAGVRSGGVYELVVELPSGTARGVNRVIEIPVLTAPEPGARVPVIDSASISVGIEAPSAAGAEVWLELETAYHAGSTVSDAVCGLLTEFDEPVAPRPVDSISMIKIAAPACRSGVPAQPLDWDSLDIRLVTQVYDSVYTEFTSAVLGKAGIFQAGASAGIEGALGYFGTAARNHVSVRFIKVPPA